MLDKSKPYGEVWGTDVPYSFEQNGKYYLLDGTEVTKDGKKKVQSKPESK